MAGSDLVLASTSKSRQTLLANAGIEFAVIAPNVDEDAVREAFLGNGTDQELADLAMILAQAKATVVSDQHAGKWVIGADQILICDNTLYNKPTDVDAARAQLLALSAKQHSLETAVACAHQGEIIWSYREAPTLKMRAFTPQFLGRYLAAVGDEVTSTVGGYKLEGLGAQLFDCVDGDYFSILGLPLLPLLAFLRQQEFIGT